MTRTLLFLILLLAYKALPAQLPHLPEPVSDHYKEFEILSASPTSQRAWMDTIIYPPKEYGSSLTFVLVRPWYLAEQEVKTISGSVFFPPTVQIKPGKS